MIYNLLYNIVSWQRGFLPPLNPDNTGLFTESEWLIQEHVKKYKSGAAEVKELVQQVLHGILIWPEALPLDSDILNVLLSDRVADPEWVTYPNHKAHPILRWLPSKLAGYLAETMTADQSPICSFISLLLQQDIFTRKTRMIKCLILFTGTYHSISNMVYNIHGMLWIKDHDTLHEWYHMPDIWNSV
jgi:hypothetical protein